MKIEMLENDFDKTVEPKKNDKKLTSRISKSTHSLALILSYLPLD